VSARKSTLFAIAAAVLLLAGCGRSDAEQRQAFIAFMQTRVLDKPGIHVPRLTDEERESLGDYADDFAIITDFNKMMDESISSKLSSAMNAGSISSVEDVVNHRPQIRAAAATLGTLNSALDTNLAKANEARAKLDQPEDVKAVFDQTYDRLVTKPAGAFKEVVPVATNVLDQVLDLANYLDAHRSAVTFSGSLMNVTDPAVRSAIQGKLEALQGSQQALQSAQSKLQSVINGS